MTPAGRASRPNSSSGKDEAPQQNTTLAANGLTTRVCIRGNFSLHECRKENVPLHTDTARHGAARRG